MKFKKVVFKPFGLELKKFQLNNKIFWQAKTDSDDCVIFNEDTIELHANDYPEIFVVERVEKNPYKRKGNIDKAETISYY